MMVTLAPTGKPSGGVSTMSSLGKRLRRLRLRQGLTQQQLASPLFTHAYVSTIESGKQKPSQHALEHFAKKLGVGVDELMTGRPPNLTVELQLQLQEARRALSHGDLSDAQRIYEVVGPLARKYDLALQTAKVEEGMALIAERKGELQKAIDLYERAEQLVPESALVARSSAVAGRARCLQAVGDLNFAIYLLENLLLSLQERGIQDPTALVRIHASLVAAYFEAGVYEKASASAHEALRLAPHCDDLEDLANMHLNVARVLLHDDQPEEALKSLGRAEELFAQLDLKVEMAKAHLARGYVQSRRGETEAALKELDSAKATFEESGSLIDEARAAGELARIYRLSGDADAARDLLERSIATLEKHDAIEVLAWLHRELGLVVNDEDPKRAEKHLRTAIELYERGAEKVELAVTYRMLGDLQTSLGNEQAGGDSYRSGLLVLEKNL